MKIVNKGNRIEEIQDELVNGDYIQGSTLKSLPDEAAAQRWLADRLFRVQGRSFSVEREPNVADERNSMCGCTLGSGMQAYK